MKRIACFALVSLLLGSSRIAQASTRAVVIVPMADLRQEPSFPTKDGLAPSDTFEETQVLQGERVWIHATSGPWVSIEALDQLAMNNPPNWEGYRGWVLKSAVQPVKEFPEQRQMVSVPWAGVAQQPGSNLLESLPMGSWVRVLSHYSDWTRVSLGDGRQGWMVSQTLEDWPPKNSPEALREKILQTAQLFIGDPYLWGGVTGHDATLHVQPTGLDCSGLVHLSYRVNGLRIPRDAHEQYLKAEKILRAQLQPADLIFSADPNDPHRMTHVMIYAGGDRVIEAPQRGIMVRMISFTEKTGVPLDTVESGQTLKDRVIYFGRFIGVQNQNTHAHHPVHPS